MQEEKGFSMSRLFVLFQRKEHTNKLILPILHTTHLNLSALSISHQSCCTLAKATCSLFIDGRGEPPKRAHKEALTQWGYSTPACLSTQTPNVPFSEFTWGLPGASRASSCSHTTVPVLTPPQLPQGNYQPAASIRPAPALLPQEHSYISFCFTCLTLFHIDAFL